MSDSLRAAVVGAGPAGFFTAAGLLKAGFAVDMFEALPTPFGLVRSGVAPDHPHIKEVTRVFDQIAAHHDFRFIGNTTFGVAITRSDLIRGYHAVTYATGMAHSVLAGIPGEAAPGSHPAADFIAWYNGHPDAEGNKFDLSCSRAVVVGNGNVALDVARMLVTDPSALGTTEVANHALLALRRSRLEKVIVVGRRDPAHATFTVPELRELARIPGLHIELDAWSPDISGVAIDCSPLELARMKALREIATPTSVAARRHLEFRFMRAPVEVMTTTSQGLVGLKVARTQIETRSDGVARAIPNGTTEIIPCGLVIWAIGFRGHRLPEVPFDENRGVISHAGGRVIDVAGQFRRGEYVVGWIKRGPSGVIGTNKKDANDTVAKILHDREAGLLNRPVEPSPAPLGRSLTAPVFWPGWQKINRAEVAAGVPEGRPRVKIVSRQQLTKIGGSPDQVRGARG